MSREVPLRDFCSCRAGDKGDLSDVTIFASEERYYPSLVDELTTERVARHFASLGVTGVTRYEIPNLYGVKFLIEGVLGGGGAASLRADNLGKNMGGTLLRLAISLSDELASTVPAPRPPAQPFT